MSCEKCSYEHLDVHRTGDVKITYCQQCGHTIEEKRDPPRERWVPIRRLPAGRLNKPGAIAHLIPLPEKKRNRR